MLLITRLDWFRLLGKGLVVGLIIGIILGGGTVALFLDKELAKARDESGLKAKDEVIAKVTKDYLDCRGCLKKAFPKRAEGILEDSVGGYKLYRLAKAIVKQFEAGGIR